MSVQDAATGVALWRQVADGIERGIAEGRFAAGEKLPGETEIAETYRVNRHTVRRALATLAERGLVRAERGSGPMSRRRGSPIPCVPGRGFPKSSAPAATSRVARCSPPTKSRQRANWRGSSA